MKLRCLLIAKDGTVAEYVRTEAAMYRVHPVERDPYARREFKAEVVLRLDENDEDPLILYREVG